jgi:hypothetical protein
VCHNEDYDDGRRRREGRSVCGGGCRWRVLNSFIIQLETQTFASCVFCVLVHTYTNKYPRIPTRTCNMCHGTCMLYPISPSRSLGHLCLTPNTVRLLIMCVCVCVCVCVWARARMYLKKQTHTQTHKQKHTQTHTHTHTQTHKRILHNHHHLLLLKK